MISKWPINITKFLNFRERQIKIIIRDYYTFIRMTKIKTLTRSGVNEEEE